MARAKQRIPEEPKRNDNLKLLMLCLAGMVVGLGFAMLSWKLYAKSVAMQSPPLPNFATEELPAIPAPDFAAAPALPDQAAIAQAANEHAEAVAAPSPPLWADADEAVTLAWAQAHRLAADGIASAARVGAWELYRARMPRGTPIAVTGTIAWSAPASDGQPLRRALLTLDEQLPCQLILPAGIDPQGGRLRACGTFLGTDDDAAGIAVLAVADLAPVGVASTPATIDVDPTGSAIAEDPLLRTVDDYRTALERPAYEALLSLVAADPQGPSPSIHNVAGRLWKDAAPYRGQRFQATGRVIRAWEDPLVAIDRPAGITRVMRVLMHHYDTGLIGAFIRDTDKDGDTGLRIYELAVLGDQPAPRPGEEIVADGRFLKLNPRPLVGGEVRASDHAWSVLLVTKGYRVLPQRGEGPVPLFSWVLLGVGGAVLGFIVYRLVIQMRRDRTLLAELREAAARRAAITAGQSEKPGPPSSVST